MAITVEGFTERLFVRSMLVDHLRQCRVETTPILIGVAGGGRGGDVSVDRLVKDLLHLRRSFDAVSTLVDFYGFRRKGDATVSELEQQILQAVTSRRAPTGRPRVVLPYVQKHEFEALLFSDVGCFAELREAPGGIVAALRSIRDRFATPEDIDDGRETAPSKRIRALMPGYNKAGQGQTVASRIGLPTIRAECPRFDAWVRRLEALGTVPPTTPD